MAVLTPEKAGRKADGWVDDDPTRQNYAVELPGGECRGCVVRLVRQAAEWGPRYLFWSCADVDLVAGGYHQAGPQQPEDRCTSDTDCGPGSCVQVAALSVRRGIYLVVS